MPILTPLIDRVCGPLNARLEARETPRYMRVNPAVFACIRDLREREMADGQPLMFLGLELVADDSLASEDFTLVD